MKSDNYYKVAVNNTTNILQGNGLTRFSIRLPNTFGDVVGKPCKIYINDAYLLQNDGAGNTVAVDLISIGLGAYQTNSFGSTTGSNDYTIGNFSPDLITAQSGDIYIRLENPSEPIYFPALPQVLDFFLQNTMTGAQITIGNVANSWTATLCIQGDCDCEEKYLHPL